MSKESGSYSPTAIYKKDDSIILGGLLTRNTSFSAMSNIEIKNQLELQLGNDLNTPHMTIRGTEDNTCETQVRNNNASSKGDRDIY